MSRHATPSGTSLAIELLLHLADFSRTASIVVGSVLLESQAEPMLRFPTRLALAGLRGHGSVWRESRLLSSERLRPPIQGTGAHVAERYVHHSC